MRDQQIFTHFRREEHTFVERGLDWIDRASTKHQEVLTPFLNPREQYILTTLVNRGSQVIRMEKDGGYNHAERCRVCIYPDYRFSDEDAFSLAYLRISSQQSLEHREVLGSLLGLGIQRQMLGDILPKTDGADVILAQEMKDYVRSTLTKVGRKGIIISEIAREQLWTEQQLGMEQQAVVSSLRLDAIVAAVCRISRAKAAALVRLGKCKVNWQTMDQADYILSTGDVISVRGYGRIRLCEVRDATKKGRLPIRYFRNL